MKQLRIRFFETNSSGTHSICITSDSRFVLWKDGKAKARRVRDNIDDNFIGEWGNPSCDREEWEFSDDPTYIKNRDLQTINERFTPKYAKELTCKYEIGEYRAYSRYEDGLFITWEEYLEIMKNDCLQGFAYSISGVGHVFGNYGF